MFDPASRYYTVENAEYLAEDGSQVIYKKRRFLPPKTAAAGATSVTVNSGERLDMVAARSLGDPLLFWRIADANGALNPFHLAKPGRILSVPRVTFRRAGS